MSNNVTPAYLPFDKLGIKPSILAVLKKIGIETPTPIQAKAIPVAISGQDLFGVAQTGTGKTFAFGIPMIQRLAEVKGRALVLLPTRELANQVEESLKTIGRDLGLKTISIIGGEVFNKQLYSLRRNPHVIVATPGRLLDHVRRKTIRLDDISVLVLDEADMMFDLGFAPQIEDIIKLTPKTRQTLLFSATMPAAIIRLAEKYLKSPLQIQVAPSGATAELVDQEIYYLKAEDKFKTMTKLLGEYKKLVLIFVRTRHGATNLTRKLNEEGFLCNEIHSNLSFNQRKYSLAGFKDGTKRILVATDVAARGLDINDIQLVLNYDLPDNSEDYIHRIGRTARAGKGGKAISFSLPGQIRDIQKIERLIKKNLPITKIGVDLKPVVRNSFSDRNVYSKRSAPSSRRFSENKFSERKPYGSKKSFGSKKQFEDRDSSTERKTFGARKTFGSKKSFGDNKFEDKKTFTERKTYVAKKSFGDKKFSDRESFGERKTPGSRRSFGDKKFGDKKSFGEEKSFSGKKKISDKSFTKNKPFAAKKSLGSKKKFDDKKTSEKKVGASRFAPKKIANSSYKSKKFNKDNFNK